MTTIDLAGPIRRLAVVARGEAAMRLIHAVRELNAERAEPIRIIALYTDSDRQALFVRNADEAYGLGSSLFEDDPDGTRKSRYLDYRALERALVKARVDTAWVGWGFAAERPEFADLCARLGIVLVGPDGAAMRRLGDRVSAKALAEDADVPVGPLSRGRGRARHIEVEVIADRHGGAWAVGVRDCTCRRRNRTVIAESGSPGLTSEQEREVARAALRLVRRAGHHGAGTVEFLYQPDERRFSFIGVNTCLHAEHSITEAVTGLDLVKLQLHVAAGGRLVGDPPPPNGCAVAVRLNAEDPARGVAPTADRVALLRLPTGPGVRIDTGIAQGDVISAESDSMIAKLIAWAPTRREALARLRRALAETVVVLENGMTNQSFLLNLVTRPEILDGVADAGWLDRLEVRLDPGSVRHADAALVQAAIELFDAEIAGDRARFYAFARRGRPEVSGTIGRTIDLRLRGQSYRLSVAEFGPGDYRVEMDGAATEVHVDRLDAYERRLAYGGELLRALISVQGGNLLVEVDGVPHRVAREGHGLVRSLAPGVVVSIPVEPGDEVQAGDVVAVVEAMKVESSLTAPFPGRVRRVLTHANVHVAAQEPLVQIEPLDAEARRLGDGERVALATAPAAAGARAERCRDRLQRLEWLVLGYDVPEAEGRRLVTGLLTDCSDLLGCDPALVTGEHRLLDVFADLRILTRPHHEDDSDAILVRSPQEYLHGWLRSLDTEAEGLPPRFVALLARALARYGIEGLERTPALEQAGYRLFLSQERSGAAGAAVAAILEHRLDAAPTLVGRVGERFREVLDRLVVATEGRDPELAQLAREVRYRYYDEPIIESARTAVYDEAERHLAALAADPQRSDATDLVHSLVACMQPLASVLTQRMLSADSALRRLLLEVMTRRYYRVRALSGLVGIDIDGRAFLAARCDRAGAPQRLVVAFIDVAELAEAVRAVGRYAALDSGSLVADLYARHPAADMPRDDLARMLQQRLEAADPPPSVRRIVVALAAPQRGRGMSAVDIFTFRRSADGLVEDLALRGIHPVMAQRVELWRLANFELERLPSAEDVYLFRGIARANPNDERLFGIAEVRDLTPVRDAEDRVVGLPELERMLVETLAAMRAHIAHRAPRDRPLWNRVLLHVWPVVELEAETFGEVVERHAAAADSLGIEMTLVRARARDASGGEPPRAWRLFSPAGHGVVVESGPPATRLLEPLDEGTQRIVAARRRGTVHPAEIVRLLAPAAADAQPGQPAGEFVEHELDDDGGLVPIERRPATNRAGVVVGTVRSFTSRYPEGMLRVVLLGDPTKALGSLAEPECRRIIAAVDQAEHLGVPLEWFALSAGARIALDSGSETIDWIAAVLRRIVEFTQAGGELNVVVTGINVGAQPYFNAEATMLMHTKGVLVMTPDSAMVLTGKQSLDYSGGVSAEDNFGIGGYERIMGPNGQAQYWAPDLAGACRVLQAHYEHAYVAPGERFPRPAATSDPVERDVRSAAHSAPGSDLATVGDVFSQGANPARKKPFDIRSVMRATIDADHPPLERWAGMRDAEIAVVWDAHLGGHPVALLGIESRPRPRYGAIPADGPAQWTAGTLFPRSSKKIARAINAASGRRPLVVLANLAGFDGSPESMRNWQLEYGAEIARAIVNFDGPIVFCVVSRYHGGASAVFSQRLNDDLETIAVEGARVSIIGGAPAAAVVFARQVDARTGEDPRIASLDERIGAADGAERRRLREQREELWRAVRAEKVGELADEFDAAHSVERALRAGSVSSIISAAELRPSLIAAVERGKQRTLDRLAADHGSNPR
jgi:acetyl/propionyl-CoA carboxylase alpha subunit/acetyl-CoA carboxylase carboxyltransferase component